MRTETNRPTHLAHSSAICVALMMISPAGSAASQKFEKQLTLPAEELRELDIVANEGELTIIGSPTADAITVVALVTVKGAIGDAEFAEFLDTWMDLDLYRHGRSGELISKISAGSLISYQPRIDLQITMPPRLNLVIKDTGGTIEVSNIDGSIRIKDGSGKIVLNGVSGDIEIDDGAGSLDVTDSVGDIEIHDQTGWVRLNAVDGSVFLDKQSGKVRIDGLSGDLVLEGDTSVEIESLNLGGEIRRQD